MKWNKDLLLLFIPYITICGAIYQMSFWGTFNINGLAFINISDIVKSAVYPCFSVAFVMIVNSVTQNFIIGHDPNFPALKQTPSNFTVFLFWAGAFVLYCVISYFTKIMDSPNRWITLALLNWIFIAVLLINNNFLKGYIISENLRRFIIDLIVIMPLFSFFGGKYESSNIQSNVQYRYAIIKTINPTINRINSDTIKFIGYTDKYFVFTGLRDSNITFIQEDKVDTLKLYDKK